MSFSLTIEIENGANVIRHFQYPSTVQKNKMVPNRITAGQLLNGPQTVIN
jgi:hypothetical protein